LYHHVVLNIGIDLQEEKGSQSASSTHILAKLWRCAKDAGAISGNDDSPWQQRRHHRPWQLPHRHVPDDDDDGGGGDDGR
jgi:hypothetical protein